MHAGDQRIGRDDQATAGRHIQESRIVGEIERPFPPPGQGAEVSGYQREFIQRFCRGHRGLPIRPGVAPGPDDRVRR